MVAARPASPVQTGCVFVLSAAGGHLGFLVQVDEWVEYTYIKKCALKLSSPEATCYYVKPGSVFCCGTLCGEYLARHGLQTGFHGCIVADVCEEGSQEVLSLWCKTGHVLY